MVKIRKNIVSADIAKSVTYGGTNSKSFIVIHETANTSKGANADAHGRLQANGNSRQASWHYSVDDKEVVQSFSDNAQCWHAGNAKYNKESIGIEICVNSDGDYKKAVSNAIELTKQLMSKYNISSSNVVQHNKASGKDCPRYLRDGSKGVTWSDFMNKLDGKATSTKPYTPKPPSKPKEVNKTINKSIAQMAQEVIDGKHGQGHDNRRKSLGVDDATYQKVRSEINKRLGASTTDPQSTKPKKKSIAQMANEVNKGLHGNGHENRRKSLGISQSEYNKVRAEVNRRSGIKTVSKPKGKSISQMATEVINGKHDNGHAARRKSLGITQAQYNKVRTEVNKRLK